MRFTRFHIVENINPPDSLDDMMAQEST